MDMVDRKKNWTVTTWKTDSDGNWDSSGKYMVPPMILVEGEEAWSGASPLEYAIQLEDMALREDLYRGPFFTLAGQFLDAYYNQQKGV